MTVRRWWGNKSHINYDKPFLYRSAATIPETHQAEYPCNAVVLFKIICILKRVQRQSIDGCNQFVKFIVKFFVNISFPKLLYKCKFHFYLTAFSSRLHTWWHCLITSASSKQPINHSPAQPRTTLWYPLVIFVFFYTRLFANKSKFRRHAAVYCGQHF